MRRWGVTKHFGGARTTEELIGLCHIRKGKYVLDVGCGVGKTVCRLAKRHGCRVVGVDLSGRMVAWAKKRAKKQGVAGLTEFMVANAEDLPFDDNTFDAVISESVTTFANDRQKALCEYARVAKPGGYVGINEEIWVEPPPKEILGYTTRVFSLKKEIPYAEGWKKLLEGAGLKDVVSRPYKTKMFGQMLDEMRLLSIDEIPGMSYRLVKNLLLNPEIWGYLKWMLPVPRGLLRYIGSGLFVGRK